MTDFDVISDKLLALALRVKPFLHTDLDIIGKQLLNDDKLSSHTIRLTFRNNNHYPTLTL